MWASTPQSLPLFLQVDEVDEEVSWGDEAQGAANPSQRMTTSPHHGHLSRKNG
jgi:hypothetical protein